ncbi:hypothetical protein MLD38_011584 [Melastoma candidum]|uniref:Uncharacterized protein n=1 Tax=Melastoma candidum TaxID=119954 RepID=A0ACB9RBW1_9MYRT|nr:hypothetical protein MLD38_011584 [Melastoma candidum]
MVLSRRLEYGFNGYQFCFPSEEIFVFATRKVVDSQVMPPKHDEVKFNPSIVELPVAAGHEMFTCAAVLRSSLQNVNSPVKSLGLNPSGCQSCSSRCQKQPPIEPEEGIAK